MPVSKRPFVSRIPFLFSGGLAALAFPPLNLWFAAWFALIPLIFHARSLTFFTAFRRGWWGGLLFNAILLYWIAMNIGAPVPVAVASYIGLLLVLPLYWGAFCGIWAFLWRKWGDYAALLLPAVWVGLEVVKNAPEIGFPWLEMGLSQIGFLPAAQIAEIGGIRFVSAWVVTANVALFFYLIRRNRLFITIVIILAAGVVWGTWRMHHLPEAGPPVKAVIVQGNIDPLKKWSMDPDSSIVVYENLTMLAAKDRGIDLVIWPETAAPVFLAYQAKYRWRIKKLAKDIDAPLLTGASHYEYSADEARGHDRFNSAFFFPADGSSPSRYDKVRLVPFGERVPFQRWFPSLGELNLGQAEFTPGKEYSVFEVRDSVRISAQICFESVFSQETRRFVLAGARVLCNLTNDGWYGESSGPYQHAALARYQCIITRCPLLRSANTGISLAADRSGRIVNKLPLNRSGTLTAELLSGGEELTFYVSYGEIIPWLLSIIALAGIMISLFRSRAE